jgi:hypothetical protein
LGATCFDASLVVDAVTPAVLERFCSGATCSGALLVIDAVAPVVPSCSGLSIDAELGWDIRIVTFTTCTLANTIDAVLNEFSGTYRSELRWMVVKA